MLKAKFGQLRAHLNALHTEVTLPGVGQPKIHWRAFCLLLFATLLLVVYHYYGKPSAAREMLSLEPGDSPLAPYLYWASTNLTLRLVLPVLFVWAVLRERVSDYGLKLTNMFRGWPVYLGFYLLMLPILWWASHDPAFVAKYPLYRGPDYSLATLATYEACYGAQFFALEFFFRGFLLFGLYARFGHYALFIATIPYCMIHFGKPWPETFGAIVAGLVLGYLALKNRSVYLGFFLHWGIGLTMDLMALSRRGLL